MDRAALQAALAAAQSRIDADPAGALARTGMPTGLAFLALTLLDMLAAHDDQDEVADLLGDLVGKQHRKALRRALDGERTAALCAIDRDALLRDACHALVQSVGAPETHAALDVQMRVEASDHSTASQVRQVVVQPGGSYHEAPRDLILERQERALDDYLRSLRTESSPLQLSRIDATEARYQQPMRLERVYIGLNTESQVRLTSEDRLKAQRASRRGANPYEPETRPLTALEALASDGPARLMLLGAPGSGKSTFVNHLVLCLAGALLCERHGSEPQPEDGWLARLSHWPQTALLPVRVVLRDLAAFPLLAQAKQGTLDLLIGFLQAQLGAQAEAIEPIKTALSDGRAILLFDGLDEVIGEPALPRVAECIIAAAGTYTRCSVLVTCRVLDYQSSRVRQLRGFHVETLAALSDEQIGQFVEAWYGELVVTGRQALGNAPALRSAIATRPELRALATSPLLLTMMAVVHAGKGTLPDARALLYLECINLLLLRWRQSPDQPDLLDQLQLPQFRASDLLALMARLGYEAHALAERRVKADGRPADLSELEVMRLLADGFASYDEARKYELAETLLRAVARGNGLLQQRGPNVYTFPHRTFQEFLAGYYLAGQSSYVQRCAERASAAHWHEALLLMVGYQVLAGGELEKPLLFAEALLRRGPLEQTLAGELLNLVGRERAPRYDPAMVQPGGLWPRAQHALLNVVTTGVAPDAPATLRTRAGLALGMLSYGAVATLTEPTVSVPFPDTRLPLAVIGTAAQREDWWPAALDTYWCAIEAGPFWYGDDTQKNTSLQQMTLPYPFKIGRYPVTNAEYQRFIDDGGYANDRWWTTEGWKRREGEDWVLPRFWDDAQYNNPAQPVVGISWYEATAYCAWLTAQGHQQGWLSTTDEARLPTSLEWERAARHTDQRRYPWGTDEPTPEHANYDKTGVGTTSPVGCFHAGAAVCGALDLVGNVMEWMATEYENPLAREPEQDFTQDRTPALSYTGFRDGVKHLCCGARYWLNPYYGGNGQGFRVVCSPRSSE